MKIQPHLTQSQRTPNQGTQPGGPQIRPSRPCTPRFTTATGWGGASAAQARMLLLAAAVLALALPRVLAAESYVAYIGPVTGDTRLVPTIVEDPRSVTKLIGETATFSVTMAGTPPFSFQWRCNGTNLADGNRISGTRTSTLTITNVQSGDYSFYTVVVSIPLGSVTSAPAWLRVLTVEHLTLSVSNQTPVSFDFTNAAWVEVTLTAPFPNPFIWYTDRKSVV